jgi:GrpB-like predicted nucleotidyltransferase (UPF0157 family)
VHIYRFDDEITIPITQHGSRFRIGPLTGPDSGVRVQMMYLPADGLVGTHPAAARQFFAVVAGSGWVAGSGGARRDIGPGYAALWEPGEEHGAGTRDGLTAVCVEGSFEPWGLRVTTEIEVRDYDPAWASWFDQLSGFVWPAVRDVALRIDHVGSTSVPGLAAKPIIDMDIVVASEEQIRPAIDGLASIGYRWRGDLGVRGRQAFSAPPGAGLPRHHLYLVVENNKAHLDHWLLRDLLREDPASLARYAALKRRNVELADGDMEVYVAAKAALVAELLTRARAEHGFPAAEYWEPEVRRPEKHGEPAEEK